MRTNKEIRSESRQELKGYWTMPVLATLVYILISMFISMLSNTSKLVGEHPGLIVLSFIAFLLVVLVRLPLDYGYALAFLKFLRADKEDTVERIFDGFKTYGRAIGLVFLRGILTFLFMLLLIVPGIIKSLAYSMSVYVAHDHPELSSLDCIYRSEDLMRGQKKQLFLMYLGFLGLIILCFVFTLGIGLLWCIPYMQLVCANFYEEIKRENEQAYLDEVAQEEEIETEKVDVEEIE